MSPFLWISRWNQNRIQKYFSLFIRGHSMGSNHEKNWGRKSRDTLPLRAVITLQYCLSSQFWSLLTFESSDTLQYRYCLSLQFWSTLRAVITLQYCLSSQFWSTLRALIALQYCLTSQFWSTLRAGILYSIVSHHNFGQLWD